MKRAHQVQCQLSCVLPSGPNRYEKVYKQRGQCEHHWGLWSLTLHEVEHQNAPADVLGCHLDPPLEEEWEEQHSDQTLASQSSPLTLWLGLAEGGS